MLQALRNLESIVDHKLDSVVEANPSTASDGSESNGTHERPESNGRRERVAVKRSANDPDDNESLIKKPRIDNELVDNEASETTRKRSHSNEASDEASGSSNEGGSNESSDEAPNTVDDEMNGHQSVMNIKANMSKNDTLEYLHQWLSRNYDLTTKFYTIKKYSRRMGTFMFYVAIDVTLDEAKDDIHVVINSDHLNRPDIIFRFIEDCFQERKVVTLLHIVTSNEHRIREDPARLQQLIRTMVEPIVMHL